MATVPVATYDVRKADASTKLALFIATFFGSGFLPKAPGTWGTAATIPFVYLLSRFQISTPWQIFTAVAVTVIGSIAAHRAGKFFGVVDASHIVVDETAGLLVTMCGVPFNAWTIIAGFVLFRVLDVVKPWPASYFDKKVKNGAGVVLDDVAAGLYGRAILAVLAVVWPAHFA